MSDSNVPVSHVLSIFCGLAGFSFLLTAGGIGVVQVVPRLDRAEAFSSWTATEATIVSLPEGSAPGSFKCVYLVDGQRHEGFRITEGLAFGPPKISLVSGTVIPIRFNPQNPKIMAVREPTSDEKRNLIGLFVATPLAFALALLGLSLFFFKRSRKKESRN